MDDWLVIIIGFAVVIVIGLLTSSDKKREHKHRTMREDNHDHDFRDFDR